MKILGPKSILATLAALLALALIGTALHAEEPVTLVGELALSDTGGYILIEEASGDAIPVSGPAELEEHLGTMVRLTGEWVQQDDGYQYFQVSKVEPASETVDR